MFLYYSRTSTIQQNASRQLDTFKLHGHVTNSNVFLDKIQGNVPFLQRPEAAKLFDIATSNKNQQITIVIDSIDRLGRNLINILETIKLFTDLGINLKSIKEGFETLTDGKENPMAKMVISVMATIADLERSKIKERQMEGVKIAKGLSKYTGRKVGSIQSKEKLIEKYPIVIQKLKKGMTIRDIVEVTGVSSATVVKIKKVVTI